MSGLLVRPAVPPRSGSFRHGLPGGIVVGMRERASEHGQPGLEPGLVTVDDVRAARERIAGVVRRTPTSESETLSRLTGRSVLLKPEHLQRTGSFKIRGAYNRISRLEPGTEVVAASAGNHAQGVALAATLTGHQATIFMPASAPLPKVDATTAYGATVRLGGETVDDSIVAAKRFAEEHGAVFVPPFDDPLIIAGQGTIGLELLEEAPEVETVVVSVGGGGLISGIAATVAALRPDVRVIGVEPAGAACMAASLRAGRCVGLDRVVTMADGVALKSPSPLTLAHVRAYVHELVTVTEEEISQALLLLLERAKAVVEPAGAARRPGRPDQRRGAARPERARGRAPPLRHGPRHGAGRGPAHPGDPQPHPLRRGRRRPEAPRLHGRAGPLARARSGATAAAARSERRRCWSAR